MYALQDLRSFHSLLIAAGLISIIGGRFEDRSPRGTGSSLDSIVLVGYSSHRDGRSFVRWTFEHGDGDTDGGCARFIKGWGEKRSMRVDKLDEGDLRRMWLFLVQEGFNFVDSYGFPGKTRSHSTRGFQCG